MGQLEYEDRTEVLFPQTLFGRSPRADVVLSMPEVSSQHASISWSRKGWSLIDLASSNGTWHNDKKIDPGTKVLLSKGDRIAFGRRAAAWTVTDLAAPRPMAVCEDGTVAIGDAPDALELPHPDAFEVGIARGPSGAWIRSDAEGEHPAANDDLIDAGGKRWKLVLPASVPETSLQGLPDWNLSLAELHLEVSRDEEHVRMWLEHNGERLDVTSRSYHYTLLTLARLRQRDVEQKLPEPEQGWIHGDDLTKMLRVSRNTLHSHVFRARRQLEELNVLDAHTLVERRNVSGQVRMGIQNVRIHTS